MSLQTTLARPVSYTDIGLHSGQPVSLELKPALADSGIVFCRVDLPEKPSVKAEANNVTSTMRATTLNSGQAKVFTVEHLMAALYVMGVDNCIAEMSSAEAPVGDGSALPFVRLIEQAGIVELAKPRNILTVDEVVEVSDNGRFIRIEPFDGVKVSFTSCNEHPLLGQQVAEYEVSPDVFIRDIAPARTIGFMHEVNALKAQGLALGRWSWTCQLLE